MFKSLLAVPAPRPFGVMSMFKFSAPKTTIDEGLIPLSERFSILVRSLMEDVSSVDVSLDEALSYKSLITNGATLHRIMAAIKPRENALYLA